MASTITWQTLHELAASRAEPGPALSLYVDLDPSSSPTRADLEARFNSIVAGLERSKNDYRGFPGR